MTAPDRSPSPVRSAEQPVVRIASGDVAGVRRGDPGSPTASVAFLGIPYAQAPVGDLRFAAPVPPEPWTGVLDATHYGPTPQRGDMGKTLIPEPSIPGDATLNVNVFTPDADPDPDSAERLPVLVWIHGGGFIAGSPASPWYDGATFTRDGVVLVTLSYRLGFDGFGEIPDAVSNRGVRDWIAALEWVQQNISAFGGDPDRVTIGGQSAGGGAVLTLLGMEQAQHLFHGVLAISPALADIPLAEALVRTRYLADAAGVAQDLAGFRSIPEERVHELQGRAGVLGASGAAGILTALAHGLSWGPVVDGELITRGTVESLHAGVGAGKPVLIGTADDEFVLSDEHARRVLRWVPTRVALAQMIHDRTTRRRYHAANAEAARAGTPTLIGRYVTDRFFRASVPAVANARADAGIDAEAGAGADADTWAYRFSWRSPLSGHATHCLDVPFWFDCLDDEHVPDQTGEAPPQALAAEMHAAATRFVTAGDPGWPSWTARPGTSRDFGVMDASTPALSSDAYAAAAPLAPLL